MYSESHSTSGIETASQRTVRLDAVWHQFDSPTSAGEGGEATAIVSTAASRALLAARRANDFAVGDELRFGEDVGAGDAVDVRDGFLVGEASKAGKSPRGCRRVDVTMFVNGAREIVRLLAYRLVKGRAESNR